MGDVGDYWRDVNEFRKEKKQSNEDSSLQLLEEKGIKYKALSWQNSHYRCGDYDFWPTTGKFYNQKTGDSGRGVFNLIKRISK